MVISMMFGLPTAPVSWAGGSETLSDPRNSCNATNPARTTPTPNAPILSLPIHASPAPRAIPARRCPHFRRTEAESTNTLMPPAIATNARRGGLGVLSPQSQTKDTPHAYAPAKPNPAAQNQCAQDSPATLHFSAAKPRTKPTNPITRTSVRGAARKMRGPKLDLPRWVW